jgi:predicted MPP superfamily phosphohydrolase
MARRFGARRFLKRRELITLALSSPEPELPAAFSRDPEVSQMDICLDRLSAAFDGLRIVHLTDIHHSLFTPLEYVQRAVKLANLLHPDIVALTGDYVTLSPTYIWPMAQMMGKLRARLGVFAVLGNHDFKVDAGEITRALRKQRVRVLRNAHYPLRAGSATLWMVGVDDLWWEADDLPAALHGIPAREPKILLCHNPMGIRSAAAHGIDFMISGHTHGGQVRLPVVGSLRGRSKLGERFVDGWNRLNGTQIYVSRGIGRSVVPLRLNCPPEIACFCLRRRER